MYIENGVDMGKGGERMCGYIGKGTERGFVKRNL